MESNFNINKIKKYKQKKREFKGIVRRKLRWVKSCIKR